ncbi:unnamed protein product [Brassica napus]|uniref:(rape) hypothetical protein n=1 Tax=Brassica napus TaxID=3708 RepID=A0A816SLB5_BRANA|nr:unnamed protein product [Brassica napus]
MSTSLVKTISQRDSSPRTISMSNQMSTYGTPSCPALEVFRRLLNCPFCVADSYTYPNVIKACGALGREFHGRMIHSVVVKSGHVCDVVVASSLVGMYAKFNLLGDSVQVFDEMPERDVACWNAVISCFYQSGEAEKALELFNRMERSGFKPNSYVSSALVDMYGECGCLEMARDVFERMPRKSLVAWNSTIRGLVGRGDIKVAETIFAKTQKDVVESWNVMISGYVSVGNWFKAIEVYDQMVSVGVKPDVVTFTSVLSACSQLAVLEKGRWIHLSIIENRLETDELLMGALLDMYSKCGDVKEASRIFKSMPEKDAVSWTVMISAYGSHGQPREALHHFDEMQKLGVKPDSVTFLALLSACGHAGFIDEVIKFFNEMRSKYGIKPSVEHYSCLVDILGRAGRLLEAYDILQQKSERRDDAELLRTLFSACCLHRDNSLGYKIARLLLERYPDDASTYTVLFNLYAYGELWDAAREVKLKMKEVGLNKTPGCSWIEINEQVCHFFAEDRSHPQADNVYDCLALLSGHIEASQ